MSNKLLEEAKAHCLQHKLRLTQPRLAVLEIIAASAQPLGAYQTLEELSHILPNPKPPTVYRAIEFWQKQGFIHRIESLNAYVACQAGHLHQGVQFMICEDCGVVIENHLSTLPDPIQHSAKQQNFVPSQWNIEIHGRCQKCL